jgi:hypothetical protein
LIKISKAMIHRLLKKDKMINEEIAAVTAVLAATIGAVTHYTSVLDRRSFRNPIGRLYSYRNDTWARVQANPLFEGWFRANLRCSKATFEIIVSRILDEWTAVNEPLHCNTHFQIRDRVAVCLHYLCHSDGLRMSGAVFGMRYDLISVNSD